MYYQHHALRAFSLIQLLPENMADFIDQFAQVDSLTNGPDLWFLLWLEQTLFVDRSQQERHQDVITCSFDSALAWFRHAGNVPSGVTK